MSKSKVVIFNVFFGEEDYLLDRELQRARLWPDRQVTSLDGKTTESQLLDALRQFTLDDTGIVVVLDDAQKVKLGAAFTAYIEQLDSRDTSTVLVAVYRKPSLSKEWEALRSKGRLIEHRKFKPWEVELLEERLRKEADMLGMVLKPGAFKLLQQVYHGNVSGMINELKKISYLVAKGGDITETQVKLVCRRQLTIQPWEVAELASKKELKKALLNTGLLFQAEGDGVAVPIVASLMNQTEKLLAARSMLDKGKSLEAIGAVLNMQKYRLEKVFLPIVKKHTTAQLLNQMKMLCELETQVKGAAQSKRTLVELAVHQLAAA